MAAVNEMLKVDTIGPIQAVKGSAGGPEGAGEKTDHKERARYPEKKTKETLTDHRAQKGKATSRSSCGAK